MRKQVAGLVGVLSVIFLSSWVTAEVPQPNPKNGQALYGQHCVRCHGQSGNGMGPDAQYLIVPPANFQSLKSRSKTDWELLITISHGIIFSPMHGWRDRLSEQDMMDIISYIRVLAPFNPVT